MIYIYRYIHIFPYTLACLSRFLCMVSIPNDSFAMEIYDLLIYGNIHEGSVFSICIVNFIQSAHQPPSPPPTPDCFWLALLKANNVGVPGC